MVRQHPKIILRFVDVLPQVENDSNFIEIVIVNELAITENDVKTSFD